jgi:glycosyltransferase involved in cell wall biosynthesis
MAKRILFLGSASIEQASTRYRVLQYVPALNAAGFDVRILPFLTPDQERRLYTPGINLAKLWDVASAGLKRLATTLSACSFDLVVITREAMLYGPPLLEWWIGRIYRRRIVYDYDDAVYVPYVSPTYGKAARWLKCPWKTDYIIRMSKGVLAASPALVKHARELGANVTLMPTVVDVDQYQGAQPWPRTQHVPVIGWIGSHSTARYLKIIAPALEVLATHHDFIFRVIGAREQMKIPGVQIESSRWTLEGELRNFRSLDIGVYPIFDDAWSQGKAAFKAIQYMAAGVPCVSSPVGMTCDVIEDGVTGLLARTTEEWISRLEALLQDPSLRHRLAANALNRIRQQYSLDVHAPRLVEVLRTVAGK